MEEVRSVAARAGVPRRFMLCCALPAACAAALVAPAWGQEPHPGLRPPLSSQTARGEGAEARGVARQAPSQLSLTEEGSGVRLRTAAPGTGPVIEVKPASQDGGTVEEGTAVHYRFEITNRGPADLEIAQVKPSCGCTVPHWDKLIKPNGEGVIEAEVHTERFRGPIQKHLTVFSNDPDHPQIELTLTAKVTPLVQVDPGVVSLLSIDDKPVMQEFTLQRTGGQPMQVLQVIATQPYLKTELTALPGPGRYKLAVTATPDAPMGRTPTPVVVRTDLTKCENLTLTLIVDRGVLTIPPMLFLGQLPRELKAPAHGTVTVMRQKGPFHVTGVSVDDPKLTARLETVREGFEYHIFVSYAGGWDPGVVRKSLTITTDDPKQPSLVVPVQATIESQEAGATTTAVSH
jgi:Protein of unknown function (DUF1573)